MALTHSKPRWRDYRDQRETWQGSESIEDDDLIQVKMIDRKIFKAVIVEVTDSMNGSAPTINIRQEHVAGRGQPTSDAKEGVEVVVTAAADEELSATIAVDISVRE